MPLRKACPDYRREVCQTAFILLFSAMPHQLKVYWEDRRQGIATMDIEIFENSIFTADWGYSQTTQIPPLCEFIKKLLVSPLFKDAELHCGSVADIRQRQ